MEYFPTILALVRAAIKQPNPVVVSQANRLVKALRMNGEDVEADAVSKLLEGRKRSSRIEPSRVVLSLAGLPGEKITPNVRPPVDKETGTSLADIRLPTPKGAELAPVLNTTLQISVSSLIEEWQNIDQLQAVGVRPPLNCMLYGAPGTGKTRLAHVIGLEVGLPLVTARLDGLISSYLGTTARNISALFAFANRYKCVLLLDEFDAIAKVRDDPHEVGEIKRVVNTLLQCLDARSQLGITIAITNHEHLLDSAIWRRFDTRILVPKPDFQSRFHIVERYANSLDLTQPELRFLVWLTDDFSGSEIETLANALKRSAVLSTAKKFMFLKAIATHAMLSANHQKYKKWRQLLGPTESLAGVLNDDKDLAFTQEDLAQILGKDQSTISRWTRKLKEQETI